MEAILISACLLGNNCKYNGNNNLIPDIKKLASKYKLICVCPETMGKLPIPRVPSEIQGDMVVSKAGKNVTSEYNLGAEKTLFLAKKYNCKIAVLKESSPSCGSNLIYDGTFTGKKIPGLGVTSKLLKANGITLYNENNFMELIKD